MEKEKARGEEEATREETCLERETREAETERNRDGRREKETGVAEKVAMTAIAAPLDNHSQPTEVCGW